MKFIKRLLLIFISIFILLSCSEDYFPKPKGYLRLDMPVKSYVTFDTNYPYSFEYPDFANIQEVKLSEQEPYWINVVYPQFKAKIHISYKKVDQNIAEYIEDAHKMVSKLIPKADNISNQKYVNDLSHVYGLVYKIEGSAAASPYQFYVTDSTHHFLRGALYFNHKPNNDSLAPVIDYIREDINHLIESLEWKK